MSSEEVQNKEVQARRVNSLANQSVVVMSFKRTYPEKWVSSNRNNHLLNMTTFEQWNYGDGQRGILPSIKKGVSSY